MRRLIVMRVLWTIPILLGASLVSFFLLRAIPGDYAQVVAGMGSDVPPDVLENIRRSLGLDQPLWQQYLDWLGGLFRGDLGTSLVTRSAVGPEILSRLLVTVELTLIAALMAIAMGAATGLASARLRGWTEWLVRAFNGFALAIPNFVVATLIVLLAGLYFPSLPIFGYVPFGDDPVGNVSSMLLPAASLALGMSVTTSEHTRAAVLEVSSQDYVLVARAKGLHPRTVLRRYLVKNALTPVITVTGVQFAALLGGSIVIETIFSIPGMGQLLFDSVTNRDYPVIQAIVLVVAVIVVVVNLLVDVAYAKVDARVSYERS